jgi:outer membrane protein TolC
MLGKGRSTLAALAASAALAGCMVSPRSIDDVQLVSMAADLATRAVANQEPISGPVTLYEAMARALKYNLDYRLEIAQQSLRSAETAYATSELLPKLVAKAGYSERDTYLSLAKLDIPTGTEIPATVSSQDRQVHSEDITFSWNILDFALSYVRAQQAADRYLISEEAKRKVVQRVVEDTRSAYWRAVTADRLMKRFSALSGRAQRAIQSARKLQKGGEVSPIVALTFERDLTEIQQTIEKLQRDLVVAKSQLAALMDIPPGTEFVLAGSEDRISPPLTSMSVSTMVAEALFNRPELRDLAYQRRINEREATAALLELLPGINVFVSENHDSNHLLMHPNWMGWGVTAATNLMKVTQLPARRWVISANDDLIQQRTLATTMVIMTQVHLSRIRHHHFARELETSRDFLDVQSKLLQQIRASADADVISEQTLIREEMNTLVAELRHDLALANVQSSAAGIFSSMGLDLQLTEIDQRLDVKALAARLRAAWSDRASVSARGKYLLEIERAKAEARRIEEDRRRAERQQAMLKKRQEEIDRRTHRARNPVRGSIKDDEPDDAKPAAGSATVKTYNGVK